MISKFLKILLIWAALLSLEVHAGICKKAINTILMPFEKIRKSVLKNYSINPDLLNINSEKFSKLVSMFEVSLINKNPHGTGLIKVPSSPTEHLALIQAMINRLPDIQKEFQLVDFLKNMDDHLSLLRKLSIYFDNNTPGEFSSEFIQNRQIDKLLAIFWGERIQITDFFSLTPEQKIEKYTKRLKIQSYILDSFNNIEEDFSKDKYIKAQRFSAQLSKYLLNGNASQYAWTAMQWGAYFQNMLIPLNVLPIVNHYKLAGNSAIDFKRMMGQYRQKIFVYPAALASAYLLYYKHKLDEEIKNEESRLNTERYKREEQKKLSKLKDKKKKIDDTNNSIRDLLEKLRKEKSIAP